MNTVPPPFSFRAGVTENAGPVSATAEPVGIDPMVGVRAMAYAGRMNLPSRFTLLAFLLTASLVALATTGCQTSKGFGKDVEKLGDKIQEKSS